MWWLFSTLTIFYIFVNVAGVDGVKSSGKEYIIAFMENEVKNESLEIFITPDSQEAEVQVTSPKCPDGDVDYSFELQFGSIRKVTLNVTIFMITGTSRSFCSVYVTATEPIVIYGLNKEPYSTDGFLQLPTNALGKQYYIVSRDGPGDHSEFLIVGTYDSTTVLVTLSKAMKTNMVIFEGKKFAKGDVMIFQIQRFECVQIQCYGDLTGSKIEADKDIGVYGGHDLVTIGPGAADHLSEMLPSIDKWGKTFITIPFPERKVGDNFRFISSEDNTTISLSGECEDEIFLLTAGDFEERILGSDVHCFIEADKAILTVQFSRGNGDVDDPGDPSMMLVQSLENYVSVVSFMCPKGAGVKYTNFLMITIESKYKVGLSLDGQAISEHDIVDIKGLSYSATSLKVSEGTHVLKHKKPNVGFASYLYGRGEYESYAFPVGMRMASINTECHPSSMDPGDDVDNDCDGKIDEEQCYDAIDDDDDGILDEDCAYFTKVSQAQVSGTSNQVSRTSNQVSRTSNQTSNQVSRKSDQVSRTSSKQASEGYSNLISKQSSPQVSRGILSVFTDKPKSGVQDEKSLRPIWVTYMEAAALVSVLIVMAGAVGCCCQQCFVLMRKKNSKEDENIIIIPWKKGRQSPMKRPGRKNS